MEILSFIFGAKVVICILSPMKMRFHALANESNINIEWDAAQFGFNFHEKCYENRRWFLQQDNNWRVRVHRIKINVLRFNSTSK